VSTKVEPMRIVSIYPYTRGFAYAVMDSALEVIESRLFDIKEYDHQKTMELSQNVILKHQPSIVILENTNCNYCRKGPRAKQLIRSIAAWVKRNEIDLQFISRVDIRDVFERWNAKNKYEIAEVLKRNIQDLQSFVMEKPKYPGREPNIEAIFSAVSMGVTHFFLQE
tara:strand:+ start:5213 stop:5713 length:501 start_codon:yes stop_codon:yes gene_type:complete